MIKYLPPHKRQFQEELEEFYPDQKCPSITFQVTEDCCMACSYCYQHHKTKHKMDFLTAKQFIDNIFNNEYGLIDINKISGLVIEFIGGEPFMEIDLIQNITDYFFKKMLTTSFPWIYNVRISICSNGLLYFEEKVQKYFKKYENFISFSISIDGNKELHDSCRIDTFGNGTYDRAMAAVHHFRNTYSFSPDTKMTLSPQNISFIYLAVLNLIKENYTQINLNCVFEEGWTEKEARILYNEMKKVADYIIDNELYNKIYISLFDENCCQPLSEEENNNWCGGIADTNLALDHKGSMYPCIRYMESSLNGKQPSLELGNLQDGYLKTEKQLNNYNMLSNITRRSQSSDECFYCPIASGCAWCSGLNYEINGTPNKRLTYICIMHKARSLGNFYYWNKLYKKIGLDKTFYMNLNQNEILRIISQDELNYLDSLI